MAHHLVLAGQKESLPVFGYLHALADQGVLEDDAQSTTVSRESHLETISSTFDEAAADIVREMIDLEAAKLGPSFFVFKAGVRDLQRAADIPSLIEKRYGYQGQIYKL